MHRMAYGRARMEVGGPIIMLWRVTERPPTFRPEYLASTPSNAIDGLNLGKKFQPNSLDFIIYEMKD